MKRSLAVIAATFVSVCALFSQSYGQGPSPLSLTVSPSVALPLVDGSFSSGPAFSTAWGGSLAAEYALKTSFPLALRFGAGYSMGGLASSQGIAVPGRLSEALLFAGAGSSLALNPKLSVHAFLDGGFAYGFLSEGTSAPYATAQLGLGLGFDITPNLAARLDVTGQYKAGLYGAVGGTLGLSYRLPQKVSAGLPAKPRLLELETIDLKSVFPVLRSYYDQNPVGSAKIKNTSKETVTNVRVGFIVRQYMDAPKECATIAKLEPGASIEVPLYALFNDRILDVTEPTKVTGEVTVEYGVELSQSRTATVLVNDRNALTWSDDRKAAAFVSSRDPWVLDLSGNFMATVKSLRNAELAKNLQTAIAIHEGLRTYNLGYMLSTTRPFAQAGANLETVDTLKFPRQTLSFRSGDCADLSVLYASCLEAAGVETAFITIPGHIFMAIDLGITETEAKAKSMEMSELIIQGGKVWVPIETTMRDAGFSEVWQKGAAEWRDATAKQAAAFYPVHEAWKTFAPMGLPADGSSVELPPGAKVAAAFGSSLKKAVDAELKLRLAALGPMPSSGVAASTALNNRGVLYGKYGRLIEAQADFQAAAKAGSVSALVNLGNVAMLKSDPNSAYDYYQQALKKTTGSASLYINIAKAANALGKAEAASSALDNARKLDPKAAEKYSSLAQVGANGTRAAEADDGALSWLE